MAGGDNDTTNRLTLAEVFVTRTGPTAADDDFNDNILESSRWTAYVNPTGIGTVIERNGRLEVTLNPGAANVGVTGKCFVAGDFDMQVDLLLLSWPPNNNQTVSLGLADLGSGTFGLYNVQRFSGAVESYMMVLPEGLVASASASGTGGKLRWVRSGSTLTGYYDNGAGFVALASTTVPTVPTRVVLNVGSFSPVGAAIFVAFDNFSVKGGTVTCEEVPSVSVTPQVLDFGDIVVGGVKELRFQLDNGGNQLISGVAVVSGEGFSVVGGSPFALRAGESGNVTVRFSPLTEASFDATVTFSTGAEKIARIVQGRGVKTVASPPFVIKLRPKSGPRSSDFAISGLNFGTSRGIVVFGDTEAQAVAWNDRTIEAIAPSGSGTVPVRVITANGASNSDHRFTYTPPGPVLVVPWDLRLVVYGTIL